MSGDTPDVYLETGKKEGNDTNSRILLRRNALVANRILLPIRFM
ncbi:MAG: hypothetical protein ACRCUY_04420 [Thermoguttaceae bacterium]